MRMWASTGEIPTYAPTSTPIGNESLWSHVALVGLMKWFSTEADFVLPGDVWQCPGTLLVVTVFWEGMLLASNG